MSIPESVIDAAAWYEDESPDARRVILALAENMPEDAVDAAQQELSDRGWLIESPHLRAAIYEFLKHVAGETP